MYEKFAQRKGFKVTWLLKDDGHLVLEIKGEGVGRAFQREAGKHCVQRIPENDRSGRRQTSFAVVAVLPLPPISAQRQLSAADIETTTQTGKQKAGGQNANKVASAVRMKHRPTGLTVFINGRDQLANKKKALQILTAKVNELHQRACAERYQNQKAEAFSERGRGDKIRTYNFLAHFVTDHRTGKTTRSVKEIMKGHLELLQ